MNSNTLRERLALMTVPGLSVKILQKFPLEDLKTLPLSASLKNKLLHPNWQLVDKMEEWLIDKHHHFVFIDDKEYPSQLKAIDSAPIGLFIKGDKTLLDKSQIAMVGSRNATKMGLMLAADYAKAFSENDLIVTSGLALGIDGVCHQAAVECNNPTIAVLGTGLDSVYPRQHCRLASEIIDSGGALVSEYPLGTPPKALHFPRRNRIISGLSLGVLVVEAAKRSGSLITARFAMEQGREVMALPSSVHNPMAQGCLHLIQQGAKLIYRTEDVLEELAWPLAKQKTKTRKKCSLSTNQDKVYQAIGYEITEIEQIIATSGLAFDEVCSILVDLEVKGIIYTAASGYIRIG